MGTTAPFSIDSSLVPVSLVILASASGKAGREMSKLMPVKPAVVCVLASVDCCRSQLWAWEVFSWDERDAKGGWVCI